MINKRSLHKQTEIDQINSDVCNLKLKKFKQEMQSSHDGFTNSKDQHFVNFCKEHLSIGQEDNNFQDCNDLSLTGKCFFQLKLFPITNITYYYMLKINIPMLR